MDVATITQLVGTVGFPIVVSGALFWYIVKESRETRETVQNNTQVMLRILDRLGSEGGQHLG